ncbi:hypothetical protein AQUCO_03200072v1, partial [Aquilegia coerulea]
VEYPEEYPLTTSHDTVLHIAMYSGQNELVKNLLDILLQVPTTTNKSDILLKVNDFGDTILHEATTTNKIDPDTVSLILRKRPGLLTMHNNNGELPLFRAVRFGNEKMFEYLADLVDAQPDPEAHRIRNDGVNILHIAILNESFELALKIAKKYPYLLDKRDQVGMTGLHLLSSMPLAFKSGCKHGWLRRFIYFCVPNSDTHEDVSESDRVGQGNDGVINEQNIAESKVAPVYGQKNKSKKTKAPNTCIKVYRTIALGLHWINQLCWNRIFRGSLFISLISNLKCHAFTSYVAPYT